MTDTAHLSDRLREVILAIPGVASLYPASLGGPAAPRVREDGSGVGVLVRLQTEPGASTPVVAREVAEAVRAFLLIEGITAAIEVQVGSIG